MLCNTTYTAILLLYNVLCNNSLVILCNNDSTILYNSCNTIIYLWPSISLHKVTHSGVPILFCRERWALMTNKPNSCSKLPNARITLDCSCSVFPMMWFHSDIRSSNFLKRIYSCFEEFWSRTSTLQSCLQWIFVVLQKASPWVFHIQFPKSEYLWHPVSLPIWVIWSAHMRWETQWPSG